MDALLDHEQIERIVESVRNTDLPQELVTFCQRIQDTPWNRGSFIDNWVWQLSYARRPGFMFSCVPESSRKSCALIKSSLTYAITLVDDIADKVRDDNLLEVLLALSVEPDTPISIRGESEREIARLVADLYRFIYQTLESGQSWSAIKDIYLFDQRQVLNAFRYAELVGKHPDLINHKENSLYNSHNMIFFLFADIDLAFVENSKWKSDLSQLREVIYEAQMMARIGNWVSTWEREILDSDYSSGVVTNAVSSGIVSINELKQQPPAVASLRRKILEHHIENRLMEDWRQHRDKAQNLGNHVMSIDVPAYIEGVELVTRYQLAGRGLK